MRAAFDSAELAGFRAAFDPVNALADSSPGFVWRLRGPDGHGTHELIEQPGSPDVPRPRPAQFADEDGTVMVVNVSIWTSYEALHAFVYRTVHGGLVKQRARWFLPTSQPSTALWWLPATAAPPNVEAALARLHLLRRYGPTPRAFTLRRRFTPQGRPVR
jgi:hypothetical protein